MSSEDLEKIRGLMPNFRSLYATESKRLLDIYFLGNMPLFWRMLKIFIATLPEDVQDTMWPKVEKIDRSRHEKLMSIDALGRIEITRKEVFQEQVFLERHAFEISGNSELA